MYTALSSTYRRNYLAHQFFRNKHFSQTVYFGRVEIMTPKTNNTSYMIFIVSYKHTCCWYTDAYITFAILRNALEGRLRKQEKASSFNRRAGGAFQIQNQKNLSPSKIEVLQEEYIRHQSDPEACLAPQISDPI